MKTILTSLLAVICIQSAVIAEVAPATPATPATGSAQATPVPTTIAPLPVAKSTRDPARVALVQDVLKAANTDQSLQGMIRGLKASLEYRLGRIINENSTVELKSKVAELQNTVLASIESQVKAFRSTLEGKMLDTFADIEWAAIQDYLDLPPEKKATVQFPPVMMRFNHSIDVLQVGLMQDVFAAEKKARQLAGLISSPKPDAASSAPTAKPADSK
jgi:hypothetical protein